MNPFDVIDEFAVLFITLLMMCLSTLWYSSYLFGSLWEKESGVRGGDDSRFYQKIFGTFCTYFFLLMSLAYVSAYAQKVEVSLFLVSVGIWIALSLSALPAYLWEQRSLRLWMLHAGFLGVVTLLGSYLLYAWNW